MRTLSTVLVTLALGLVAGCSSKETPAEAAPVAAVWQKSLIPSTSLAHPRGLRIARGAIHFHSPYSHDACDYWWKVGDGGQKTAADIDDTWRGCAAHLRTAVCSVGHDFIFITDHAAYMADFTIEQILQIAPGDEPVLEDGVVVANRLACANGRRPLLFAGNENSVMSIGLHRHLPGTPEERAKLYEGTDAATIDAIHAAGALAGVAHSESHDLAYLQATPLETMEVYNIHANIDPSIRQDYLGLPSLGFAGDLLAFSGAAVPDAPEPDLAMMSFLLPNDNSLAKFDAVLTQKDITGTAGTDVHENSFPGLFSDGERGDSYRRMLRWMSNNVLVDSVEPAALKAAIAKGRLYVAFDVFGSPVGFDFMASTPSGAATEMGGHVSLATSPKLVFKMPVPGGVTVDPAPVVHARLLRSTATGAEEIAAGSGNLEHVPTTPGAYRIEVTIEPKHVLQYLRFNAPTYVGRVYPWIYSNAIHVDP